MKSDLDDAQEELDAKKQMCDDLWLSHQQMAEENKKVRMEISSFDKKSAAFDSEIRQKEQLLRKAAERPSDCSSSPKSRRLKWLP